jgi:hydrogenase maturation factor
MLVVPPSCSTYGTLCMPEAHIGPCFIQLASRSSLRLPL